MTTHRALLASLCVVLLLAAAPACDDGGDDARHDAAAADAADDTASQADTSQDTGIVCEPPTVVPRETARLSVDPADGRLRDAEGRTAVLRGLNAGGRSKFAPYLPFDVAAEASIEDVQAAADTFFARFEHWGLNAVRLVFSWEGAEPTEGTWDTQYLERFDALVDAAWAHGVAVVVDIHQDVYCSSFCGDGLPAWTIADMEPGPARHDCPNWYLGYLSNEDVKTAFDHFWSDEAGARTAFGEMLAMLAARVADHPGVVGIEIMNEPGWGSAGNVQEWKRDVLTPFHEDMIAIIQGQAPGLLVVYDEPGLDAVAGSEAVPQRPAGEGLAFAPHMYDPGLFLGLGWNGQSPAPLLADFAEFREGHATPVLVGEFGFQDGVPRGLDWLDVTMAAMDTYGLSCTLWEYSAATELWNDENFSVVDADGTERAVLDAYVRPWVRALAGTDLVFTWDRQAGTGLAEWTADGGTTEIVMPPRLFPDGPVDWTLEGGCAAVDIERGEVRVAAPAGSHVRASWRAPDTP